MTGKERIAHALNFREADRIPYDLAGTTVTTITKNAYQAAITARDLSDEFEVEEVDPISQIVTPIEENLLALRSDTRRIGSMRIPEYHSRKRVVGKSITVTDFYGCDWDDYVRILIKDLDKQIRQVGDFCCVADRNMAGFTENSVRIRGYENWYMDTLRVLVIPKLKTLFTHLKKRLPHVKTFLHSCGSIRELIPDLIDAGLDILNPVQFTAANMDLEGLKLENYKIY